VSDRGNYRGIHTVLVDGPDYQALTPNARLVLLTLKLDLGPTGIDVLYPAVLEAQTGLSGDQVLVALETLEHTNWIRREKNLVWVVDGLKFEPSRKIKTNANHRLEVQGHLKGLPRLAIVDAFRRYYELEPGEPAAPDAVPPRLSPAIPDGMGDGIPDGIGEHGERRTEERKNGKLPAATSARRKREGPKFPHFSQSACDRLYAAWKPLGQPRYSAFRTALAPLFPEQPSYDLDRLEAAMHAYVEHHMGGGRADYASPTGFVTRVGYWVKMADDAGAPGVDEYGVPTAETMRLLGAQ
jgi:hypothetical protein